MSGPQTDAVGFFGIEENARRIGRYVWVETRLHDIVAAWIAVSPEPSVKSVLGRHVHLHAWHAKLWRKRLPVLWDRDTTTYIGPGDARVEGVFDALAALDSPGRSIERASALYKVVTAHLLGAYAEHMEMCDPLTDSPTARTLRFVIDDETACWNDGDALLQSLVGSADDMSRAVDSARFFEALVETAGGFGG